MEEVQEAAAIALGKLGDVRVIEPLLQALTDEHFLVRWEAAKALGELGDVRAVKPLLHALQDHHVQEAAIEALEKFRDA